MDPEVWTLIGLFFGIFGIALVLIRVLRWLLKRIFNWMNRNDEIRFDPTSYSFISNALSISILVFAFVVFIFSHPYTRAYGEKIFVGAGLLTIAVGFASQQALSNVVGGLFIVIFRPFRVNDIISVKEHLGMVEDITLRHTVIRNFENRRIVIPNSVISSETILNSSISDAKICNFFEVQIGFESDVELAFDILKEEAINHPFVIDNRTAEDIEAGKPVVLVRIINWMDSGILIRANIWTEDNIKGFQMKCDLYRTVLQRFQKAGIEIPYPHRVIYQYNSDSNEKSA